MITLGLNQTIDQIPESLSDWLKERENNFPEMEFQINFFAYSSEDDKKAVIKYEFIFEQMPQLRHVFFPRPDGIWDVKIIGDQNKAIFASGINDLLRDDKLELFSLPSNKNSYRGYVGMSGNLENEEVVAIWD